MERRGRETGVDALSVFRGERLVEVSSPRIVPAIIYFLSDRGDRLYGGCFVEAPGSASVPGSAYVSTTTVGRASAGTLKNIDSQLISSAKIVDVGSARYRD